MNPFESEKHWADYHDRQVAGDWPTCRHCGCEVETVSQLYCNRCNADARAANVQADA